MDTTQNRPADDFDWADEEESDYDFLNRRMAESR